MNLLRRSTVFEDKSDRLLAIWDRGCVRLIVGGLVVPINAGPGLLRWSTTIAAGGIIESSPRIVIPSRLSGIAVIENPDRSIPSLPEQRNTFPFRTPSAATSEADKSAPGIVWMAFEVARIASPKNRRGVEISVAYVVGRSRKTRGA